MDITITIRDERTDAAPLVFAPERVAAREAGREAISKLTKALQPRFEKITSSTGEHLATLDRTTGLMYLVRSIGNPKKPGEPLDSQQACIDACVGLTDLGFTDWRLATRIEAAAIIDDTRHEPAVDPEFFPGILPRWHWTSTPAAWSSDAAWFVNFHLGYVGYLHRDDYGFALAVRRVGQ